VLVLTLVLAAVGFAMLVVSLMTGSVLWAWLCIGACVVGAVLLLASGLTTRGRPDGPRERGVDEVEAVGVEPLAPQANEEKLPQRRGRHEKP
jgi:hypothetical protein